MDGIELSEPERDAISALLTTRRDRPEADCYVHDGRSVRMLGAAEDVSLWIGRDTLRSLGHRKLVKFDRDRGGRGRGWVFDVTPRADDFV